MWWGRGSHGGFLRRRTGTGLAIRAHVGPTIESERTKVAAAGRGRGDVKRVSHQSPLLPQLQAEQNCIAASDGSALASVTRHAEQLGDYQWPLDKPKHSQQQFASVHPLESLRHAVGSHSGPPSDSASTAMSAAWCGSGEGGLTPGPDLTVEPPSKVPVADEKSEEHAYAGIWARPSHLENDNSTNEECGELDDMVWEIAEREATIIILGFNKCRAGALDVTEHMVRCRWKDEDHNSTRRDRSRSSRGTRVESAAGAGDASQCKPRHLSNGRSLEQEENTEDISIHAKSIGARCTLTRK
ncbi:hypothetical protein BKA93DRAFT_753657 [Sparassis latifolia]